jgi:hypothetical protein
MAITRKTAQRNGWKDQAEIPVPVRAAAAREAATAAAKKARRHALERVTARPHAENPDLAGELESTRLKLAARTSALARAEQRIGFLTKRVAQLEKRDEQDSAGSRITNGPRPTQRTPTAAADKWIATLEEELGRAREEFAACENENVSLRASLELAADENARLSNALKDSDAEIGIARPQLEAMKAMLRQLEAECRKQAAAADKADETRRAETNALKTKLEGVSSQALKDKLLADVWQTMLAKNEQNSLTLGEVLGLFRHLAEKDAAAHIVRSQLDDTKKRLSSAETERNALVAVLHETNERWQTEITTLNARLDAMSSRAVAAESLLAKARTGLMEKLELLQISFRMKEEELWLLRQSRMKLIEDANTLLTIASTRAKPRDAALAYAEERIKLPAEQGAGVENSEGRYLDRPQMHSAMTLLAETIAF